MPAVPVPNPHLLEAAEAHHTNGRRERLHTHGCGQLEWPRAVAVVRTPPWLYVLPPTHAVWIPCGVVHGGFYHFGEVVERSVWVYERARAGLPTACMAVRVSAALAEVIDTAVATERSHDARTPEEERALLSVLAREVTDAGMPPLKLAIPEDSPVSPVAVALVSTPCEPRPAADWAATIAPFSGMEIVERTVRAPDCSSLRVSRLTAFRARRRAKSVGGLGNGRQAQPEAPDARLRAGVGLATWTG